MFDHLTIDLTNDFWLSILFSEEINYVPHTF